MNITANDKTPVSAPEHASCPALLVSAIASGQGKTLVTAALARLHSRQGRKVRVFKCGPDFLDPFWHELASGGAVDSVDLWMTGEADIQARMYAAARDADLILIEGVMGLFDGTPSAADLAQRFGIPVMPVLQVGSMAQTIGAVVHGLKHFRPGLPWAGVLCNGVASPHHQDLLQQALVDSGDWLGALPKLQATASLPASKGLLPERHLGLVPAAEMQDALARLDQAADALAQTTLGQMTWAEWQRWAVTWTAPTADSVHPVNVMQPFLAGQTIAVARDAAFAFVYPANLQVLRDLGAEVVTFSPIAGDALPPCNAVWLPGGYPELHAPAIAANTVLRAQLAQHLQANKPIWAECGGMVALSQSVVLADGVEQPLWGLMPGTATMQKRVAGLGMQQWEWPAEADKENEAEASQSMRLRGHTFHYSTLQTSVPVWSQTQRPVPSAHRAKGEAVYRLGSLRASYFHAWFASNPVLVARLFSPEPTL